MATCLAMRTGSCMGDTITVSAIFTRSVTAAAAPSAAMMSGL